jgi:predicted dehydrogenase
VSDPLRVGIIGANPRRGWASRAHLPAVAAAADLELVAVATTRIDSATEAAFPEAVVAETGETIPVTSPDQIAIAGTTASGVVVTAHIHGAAATRPGLVIQVRGTEGLLEITAAPSLANAAIGLRLTAGDDAPVDVSGEPDDAVARVGRVYADLRTAVRTGRAQGPDLDHAVRRHRLLDAIRRSSESGVRVPTPANA